MADLTDVIKEEAMVNKPGYGTKLLYALISDFESITPPDPDAATLELAGAIATDHTFKVGKGWKVIESTDEFTEGTAENVGDRDSRGDSTSLEGRIPGLTARNLGFKNKMHGKNALVLVDNRDGTYKQYGTEEDPSEFQVVPGSGNKGGGYKGLMVTISTFAPLYEYQGTIELESEIV